MVYDFTEKKNNNDILEAKLLALKEEYKKPEMSAKQLDDLKLKIKEARMADRKEQQKNRINKIAATAAAFVAAFLILPNTSVSIAHAMEQIPILGQFIEVIIFRDYQYVSDKSNASIEVPALQNHEQMTPASLHNKLEETTDEINAEIKEITDQLVAEFEVYLEEEEGYQDMIVESEVLATTPNFFTLKLSCYQGTGSGYQWNYYYTIDLTTGQRLLLKDIFIEGADYITLISDNIKKQMEEQMAADENISYWLNNEMEEFNFQTISEDTSFYINERNNLVISFDEGAVAPMYMGAVEFEIPAEVLVNIRK